MWMLQQPSRGGLMLRLHDGLRLQLRTLTPGPRSDPESFGAMGGRAPVLTPKGRLPIS